MKPFTLLTGALCWDGSNVFSELDFKNLEPRPQVQKTLDVNTLYDVFEADQDREPDEVATDHVRKIVNLDDEQRNESFIEVRSHLTGRQEESENCGVAEEWTGDLLPAQPVDIDCPCACKDMCDSNTECRYWTFKKQTTECLLMSSFTGYQVSESTFSGSYQSEESGQGSQGEVGGQGSHVNEESQDDESIDCDDNVFSSENYQHQFDVKPEWIDRSGNWTERFASHPDHKNVTNLFDDEISTFWHSNRFAKGNKTRLSFEFTPPKLIQKVEIKNRQDCCRHRLNNVVVFQYDLDDNENQCGEKISGATEGDIDSWFGFACDGPFETKRIIVTKTEEDNEVLTISEIRAFACTDR